MHDVGTCFVSVEDGRHSLIRDERNIVRCLMRCMEIEDKGRESPRDLFMPQLLSQMAWYESRGLSSSSWLKL